MNRNIKIADCGFLPGGKSQSLDGDNFGLGPAHFDWELTDIHQAHFVTDSFLKDTSGDGQIAWLCESYFLHPENYITAMQKNFKYVLTHNWYFAENMKHKNWLWVPKGGSWIDFRRWGVHEKTKNVSLILSEKKSMVGHQMRHNVAEKYGALIDDVFGYDYNRVQKYDGLAPYRWSIVIQPERCDFFFNEALIDCFSVGTVPIYWGCPSIEQFFDGLGMEITRGEDDIRAVLEAIQSGRLLPPDSATLERNMLLGQNYRCVEDWIWKTYPFLFEV
jgi:hypothetical protein